jgi:hypothetical protein
VTTYVHDNPIQLCRERPGFAVKLAGDLLGVPMPDHDKVAPYSESATDVEVRDLNADNVVVCLDGDEIRFGIIIEVQRKPDNRKRFSWPAYHSNIRHRIKAPVALIVICPEQSVAAWASEPIDVGQPGCDFRMLVISAANYPKLTEPSGTGELAEQVVLGTLIHQYADEIEQLLEVATAELEPLPEDLAKRYTQYMLGQLSERPRAILETLMKQETYPYQSKLLADHQARGVAEALLVVIEARGRLISDEDLDRIAECKDIELLLAWVRRAALQPSMDDILA